MRATGTLSVLFVGGLGLAVLAGPASCPCDRNVVASAEVPDSPPILSRFTYAIASAAAEQGLPRANVELAAAPVAEEDLPTLSNVAMLESEEPADTSPTTTPPTSPITTSAIDALTARAANPPSHIGLLPPTQEALPDNAPKAIQLAAAAPGDAAELAPVLPPVVVDAPLTEIEVVDPSARAAEPEAEPAAEKKRPRKHTSHPAPRKHAARQRTPNASTRQKAPVASTKPDRAKLAKVPRWARQMFDTPWQNKAFSYIQ